jgi:hypothetical protein
VGACLNILPNDPMHPASIQLSELADLHPLVFHQRGAYEKDCAVYCGAYFFGA